MNTTTYNFWKLTDRNQVGIYAKAITIFCLLNIVSLLPDIHEIYSKNGLISADIVSMYLYPYSPNLQWISGIFDFLKIDAQLSTSILITSYILSLVFVLIKYKPLLFSIVAWGLHIMFVNSSYFFSYGADYFMTFALFMVILFTIAERQKDEDRKTLISTYAIRFLQIHLCLVYFFAGFGKILGTDWFDGNAIWFVLNTYAPALSESLFYKMTSYPLLFKLLCWGTLIFEIFYPFLIFYQRTKKISLVIIITMHIGIILLMNLYTFGLIMIVLNLIAFGHYFKNEYDMIKKFILSKTVHFQFNK